MPKLLFNYETTQKTDFREGKIPKETKTTYQAKPKRQRAEYKPVKFIGTLVGWKDTLPFDTLFDVKEIVRTNPTIPQPPFEKLQDLEREKAQLTRPRVVMSPGISIDDIQDPVLREIIVSNTYTSESMAKSKEAVAPLFNIRAPLSDFQANANPLKLPSLKRPYVSKEWRAESALWDPNQLRSGIDATQEFWLHPKNLPGS